MYTKENFSCATTMTKFCPQLGHYRSMLKTTQLAPTESLIINQANIERQSHKALQLCISLCVAATTATCHRAIAVGGAPNLC